MKKKNFIPFIAIAVLCAACHDKTTLTGDWIEPVPGNTNTTQGFSLKENGEATSINMATLQYKSWAQRGQPAHSIGRKHRQSPNNLIL